MKLRCTLMRHGQAVSYHAEGDKERPLTALGEQQAVLTARQLEALGWSAPEALHSAAARTTRTAQLVAETWSTAPSLSPHHSLYLGDQAQITDALGVLDATESDCVLLVGHNPGWSRVSSLWSGVQIQMDVADAALLSIEADSWAEACASDGCWTLEHFVANAALWRR